VTCRTLLGVPPSEVTESANAAEPQTAGCHHYSATKWATMRAALPTSVANQARTGYDPAVIFKTNARLTARARVRDSCRRR
jgi:hypothetical protein